ncbi:thermonuclease family protein [Verrucomicrobiota bacterium]
MKRIVLVVVLLFVVEANAACFTGTVTRVIDGDTIVVGTNIVRLAEIDAPEIKTEYGPKAKAALEGMISNKVVVVKWSKRGRYRRIIGYVYLHGGSFEHKVTKERKCERMSVNFWMVEQGWAWQFKRYSKSKALAVAEQTAREKGRILPVTL